MEPPVHDEFAQEPPPRPSGNGMGIAGFVISLVGLLTCGILCPLGLIFSLIGLGKQPKGLAIAGTVIGALGSLLLVGVLTIGWPVIQTGFRFAKATQAIQAYHEEHGEFPAEEDAEKLLTEPDGWGTPFRYRRTADGYEITSASFDRKFETDDDLTFPGTATGR